MAIDKFQRSRLTFQPVANIRITSKYLNLVFSETTRPIELKFYKATPVNS